MPELPEVQIIVNDLIDLNVVHQCIKKVRIFWRRSAGGLSDQRINNELSGKRITAVSRRGKYIVVDVGDGQGFAIHLRMSGRLRYVPSATARAQHERVAIELENGFEIRFDDPRKFGRFLLGSQARKKFAGLGVEPLSHDFTLSWFREMLLNRHRMLKPLLLDQSFIAGMGNIYTDEALWLARIHPQRQSDSLNNSEIKALRQAIVTVLKDSIQNFGTSLGDGKSNFISVNKKRGQNLLQLKVYGREGQQCPRCGKPIKRIKIAQRSTHICEHCQRKDKSK